MSSEKSKEVFRENFSSYKPEQIIKADLLADCWGKWRQTSYHYSWKSDRIPNRFVTTFPWRIVKNGKQQFLEQPEDWPNVVVCTGDILWRDYVLKVKLIPLSKQRCGILFRYRNSRENYYLALENNNTLKLFKRADDNLVTCYSVPFKYKPESPVDIKVEVLGEHIKIHTGRELLINICDSSYLSGKIGLRTDGPARYGLISVKMNMGKYNDYEANRKAAASGINLKKKRISGAKLVKRIPLKVETDYLHIDDINNDGENEIIFIKQECLGANNTRISCLGVMDFDGKSMWQIGEPRENKYPVHGDVAFNIGDIDGDGKKEIIITQEKMIKILDSSGGSVKNEIPTPGTEYEKNITGDSFLLADLKGCGRKTDILLKDRYENIWAYDSNLKLLWHRKLNTGHYPRAADINGDGREEIMAGYSMLNADGETMWTVPGADPLRNSWKDYPHSEHADSIWIGRFTDEKNARMQVAIAASDMGFLLLDAETGELLCRNRCGHAQSLAVAKFRKGLDGLQFAVTNLWGNPGIITLFDCHGNRLLAREFPPFAIVLPVNWTGDGEAHIFLPRHNVLYDKDLEPVLHFPGKIKRKTVLTRPVANDFLKAGIDQIALSDGKCIELYMPQKYSSSAEMKHDTENFNVYGAFYLK
ncbi:MAG: hypothetical protein A2017_15285 [Lentisphaerae bacterium GWF2_44_16]|nr:MAG: hypothetical protein A2017_15285 [Lentisphaerae bacterium GWF2_44_16]